MKYVQKPWGYEQWIYNGDKYCGKKLFIKQGRWLSYHHHLVKDEVLFVESGSIWFTHDESGIILSDKLEAGHAFHVKVGVKHQMQAIQDTVLFEFSTHHEDEDSIRTTRELMIDHGDNGFRVKTYEGSFPDMIVVDHPIPPIIDDCWNVPPVINIPIPEMPPLPDHIICLPLDIPPPEINLPPIVLSTPAIGGELPEIKIDPRIPGSEYWHTPDAGKDSQ